MTKFSTWTVTVTCLLVASTLLAIRPAQADPWPWVTLNGAGFLVELPKPDLGTYHTFCKDAAYQPEAVVAERIDLSEGVLNNTTDVETDSQACGQATDVVWQQRFILEGVLGATNCQVGSLSDGVCNSWRVRVAWGEIQQYATNDGAEARHTACHELGHTVALNHYGPGGIITTSPDSPAQSCMRSGVWDDGSDPYKNYGAHHKGHINAYFP
jgi:hypothetical protein